MMSYFYPRLGAIWFLCKGSRWYFSVQLVTCALFPSQAWWPEEECVQTLGASPPSPYPSALLVDTLDSHGWVLGLAATSHQRVNSLVCVSNEAFSLLRDLIEAVQRGLGTGVRRKHLPWWWGRAPPATFLLCCEEQCARWRLRNSKSMLWASS